MTYASDSKPSSGIGSTFAAGQPMGLLLLLTYAAAFVSDGYVPDSEPSAGTFTSDTKPN